MVTFEPVHDRVILRRLTPEPESATIIIPEAAREKGQEFEVIEASAGYYQNGTYIACSVVKGDKVVLGKYAGIEIVVNKLKFLVVRDLDILGKLIES